MRGVGLWLALVMVAWLPPVDANSRDVFAWRDAGGITHFSDRPGAPSAERVETRAGSMSIVESKAPRANPLRALVEREIRWQQSHRQQQQREVLAEMAKKKVYCDRLQAQKDEADSKRQRSRLLALEDQWFAKCR